MWEASSCTHTSCSSLRSGGFFFLFVCMIMELFFVDHWSLWLSRSPPVPSCLQFTELHFSTDAPEISAWSYSGRSRRKLSVVICAAHFIWRTECASRTRWLWALSAPSLYCRLWKRMRCGGRVQLCPAPCSCPPSLGFWLIKSRYECVLGKICSAALIRSINQGLHWDLGDCGILYGCQKCRNSWLICFYKDFSSLISCISNK